MGIRSASIEASNLEAEVLEYWLSDCVCWLSKLSSRGVLSSHQSVLCTSQIWNSAGRLGWSVAGTCLTLRKHYLQHSHYRLYCLVCNAIGMKV